MLIELRACLCAALLASGMAAASEATVKREMEKKYPGVPVHSVTKTPLPGIYEVFVNGQIVYTDENVTYLIVRGRILAFGQRQAIRGTPTLFFSDGQRVTGAVPLDQLKKLLDAAR